VHILSFDLTHFLSEFAQQHWQVTSQKFALCIASGGKKVWANYYAACEQTIIPYRYRDTVVVS